MGVWGWWGVAGVSPAARRVLCALCSVLCALCSVLCVRAVEGVAQEAAPHRSVGRALLCALLCCAVVCGACCAVCCAVCCAAVCGVSACRWPALWWRCSRARRLAGDSAQQLRPAPDGRATAVGVWRVSDVAQMQGYAKLNAEEVRPRHARPHQLARQLATRPQLASRSAAPGPQRRGCAACRSSWCWSWS